MLLKERGDVKDKLENRSELVVGNDGTLKTQRQSQHAPGANHSKQASDIDRIQHKKNTQSTYK